MSEAFGHLFGWVCGQNPLHTWAPGGVLLPCCQRCTGLYIGAALAAALHFWLRPRLSNRFLEAHGVCLLQMVPFGFHWLPQGPELRTFTGLLFGFGVTTFLWLIPAARWLGAPPRWRGAALIYAAIGAAAGLGLLVAVRGGSVAASGLAWLAAVGLVALAALVAVNLFAGTRGLLELLRAKDRQTSL